MKTQVEQFRTEIQRIEGVRYPDDLRRRVAAYTHQKRNEGSTWSVIQRELGLPMNTVRRWAERYPEHRLLKPVRVREPEVAPVTRAVLVSPGGWRLEVDSSMTVGWLKELVS